MAAPVPEQSRRAGAADESLVANMLGGGQTPRQRKRYPCSRGTRPGTDLQGRRRRRRPATLPGSTSPGGDAVSEHYDHLRSAILPLMGSKQLPEPSSEFGDAQVEAIAITVAPAVHGHSLRRRLARARVRHRALVLCVAFALAALGTVIATTRPSGSASRRGLAGLHQPRAREKAAIAAAFGYPYPLRCLTVTVSASDPDYARAFVDRTNGCGRYHGYISASFHRIAGAWTLMLDEGQLYVPDNLLTPLPARHDGGRGRQE
jgi:hypothetical protein